MNSIKPKNSYISLFSSGGIGDLGFHNEKFFCVASAELLSRRIEVQRLNGIASEDRLVCGDLLLQGPFERVLHLAERYVADEQQPITTIIATPPCQGMSVANHKKGDELARNSLVVRSIEIIKRVRPLTFVFENVPAFIKTECTGVDGVNRPIGEEITKELGDEYEFFSQVLQLSEFGSPSSRKRSLTIGVRNDVTWVTPLDLFPPRKSAPSLRELIGDLPRLHEMGEAASGDLLHAFRPYDPRMRSWITGIPEGASAFDNNDPAKRPHRMIGGTMTPNVRKNGDKYRRVPWDTVAPCVHTRNDILASQNTVHPVDDRVFSIRELMRMMGVNEDFIWFEGQQLAVEASDTSLLKQHSVNIRQCLGEAIPVPITQAICANIKKHLTSHLRFSAKRPRRRENSVWTTPAQIASYTPRKEDQKKQLSAYYTEPLIAFAVTKQALLNVKLHSKKPLRVIEPSTGTGVFLFVLDQFAAFRSIEVTCIEIDQSVAQQLKIDSKKCINLSEVKIIQADFLAKTPMNDFDLALGNPPFGRRPRNLENLWGDEPELSVRFLKKALSLASSVALVMPKAMLHASYYQRLRQQLRVEAAVDGILDFGEFTFPDVKVETLGLIAHKKHSNDDKDYVTYVKSWPQRSGAFKQSDYIFPDEYPSWLIYRNNEFDRVLSTIDVGLFNIWRDRTLSRKMQSDDGTRVIRGRNLSHDGLLIEDSGDYRISNELAQQILSAVISLSGSSKFLAPNLSYSPRAVRYIESLEFGVPEGSCAVLHGTLTKQQENAFVRFASSDEFQSFYRVACNYATRSLNIDSCLGYWWGVPKN